MSSHIGPVLKCCIGALESVHGTHQLAVAAGRAIIAESNFSVRFHSLKSSASREDLLELLGEYEHLANACEEAYARFLADPSAGIPALVAAFAAIEGLAQEVGNRPSNVAES